MKKLSVIIILLLLLSGCAVQQSKGLQSNWGEARNGVQASLYTPNPVIKKNQAIELFVRFRNTQEKRHTLENSMYHTLYLKHNGKLFGESIGKKELTKGKIDLGSDDVKDFLLMRLEPKQGSGEYNFSGGLGGFQLPELKVKVE